MTKKNPLNIGVAGSGFIASNVHLPILSKLNVNLVAVCDVNENSARQVAKQYKIQKVYDNIDKMITNEKLDVVEILTPPETHAVLARKVLQNHCHCLIEKPLALTVRDADALISMAIENDVSLRVIHNYSFMPCIMKAKRIMSSGDIGKVLEVSIRYFTPLEMERYFDPHHWVHTLPGGVFSDIAPHLAMLLLDFLNENMCSVNVSLKKTTQYEYLPFDILRVTVDGDRAIGSFTLSFGSDSLRFQIDVFGSLGSLSIDADTNTVVCYRGIQEKSQLLGRAAKGKRALNDISQRFSSLTTNTYNTLLKSRCMSDSHAYLLKQSLCDLGNYDRDPVPLAKCKEVVSILEKAYSLFPISDDSQGIVSTGQ